jgi:hypothetical protein
MGLKQIYTIQVRALRAGRRVYKTSNKGYSRFVGCRQNAAEQKAAYTSRPLGVLSPRYASSITNAEGF